MAMNRQQKRMLQRQRQIDAEGQPVAPKRRPQPATATKDERTSPIQFLGEVRSELRKVAWPNRTEVLNYSVVVLFGIVVLTMIIAGLDYVLGEAVLKLFER